ncbi:uncharacterized protein NP_1924A [Natronomonas pharaonis DSM 2160]|uniref:Uncharacterized protein n=1 Tax=Natronomonas pharaonis (strain ATCC 35678 / DSM 2160 / CIP 103997 / JCM 8858 / NBRC 14720 / NCIMB 2260 / Gabara) TaxID=348780 RepID=A0A1U7EVJ4_NATPD|nr:hypothetical protein [Natronomonas pharaonis]CAI49053.1 uncharacterized protein NP_1924A [Natronomonas pharaonis DSM 2160]
MTTNQNKQERATYIQSVVKEEFDRDVTVRPVTRSLYEVTVGDDSIRYAKWWDRKFDELMRLTELDTDIGMPKSRVFEGDVYIQLMEPAPGRPLSHQLVLRCVPGLWWHSRDQVEAAVTQVGRYIGRLHQETSNESTEIDISNLHIDKYDAVSDGSIHPRLEQ